MTPAGRPAEDEPGPVAIQVRGLCKRFGSHEVLTGVDLDVERGRINFIIGGSGEGKSVLLKLIIGLLQPDAGSILIDGVDLVALSEFERNRFRRRFGMVFQYAVLFDSLTVEENIAFPLVEHARLAWPQVRRRVEEVLQALQLAGELLRKHPAELSGGQRKRVGLARALVLRPAILLYDEPTTGLDPIATKNVDDMIRDISQKTGVTSVVISHDMASTFRIGNRIAMLHGGRIVESGTPEELLGTRDPWVREFVATSGAVTMAGSPA